MGFSLKKIGKQLERAARPSRSFKNAGNVLTLRAGGNKEKIGGVVAANFIPYVGPVVSAGLAMKYKGELRKQAHEQQDEIDRKNVLAQDYNNTASKAAYVEQTKPIGYFPDFHALDFTSTHEAAPAKKNNTLIIACIAVVGLVFLLKG